jgi:hypothetical protein
VRSSAVQRNPATKSRERHNRPRRAPGEGLRTAMGARRKLTSDLGVPAHYESYVATGVTRLQTRDKGRGAVASRKGFEAGQGSLSTIYASSQIQMLPRAARPLIRPTWRSGPRLHAACASPWKRLRAPERAFVRFCRPRSTRPRSRGQLPSHKHAEDHPVHPSWESAGPYISRASTDIAGDKLVRFRGRYGNTILNSLDLYIYAVRFPV